MKALFSKLKDFWRNSPVASPALFLTLILLQFAIHWPMLDLSPRGMHVWRQVVGHAAIQNYATESDSFWNPRADIRMTPEDTGEIYHELPLTYWLAAKVYTAGWLDKNTAAHLIQLLFNLLLIPGAYGAMRALGASRDRSALFTFLISFSPLYLYYGPLLEPNLLGLSFFLLAIALYLPSIAKAQYGWRFYLGTLTLILATLAKPTYLFFGLPLAVFIVPRLWRQRSWKAALSLGVSGTLILGSNLLIINHAKALYNASPWQRQFHTPIAAPAFPDTWALVWANVSKAMTTWFLEMNLNLAALPLLLIVLYALLRKKVSSTTAESSDSQDPLYFWMAWCVSLAIFCTLFVVRLADHDYYITASLPLAALLSSRGAEIWLKSRRALPALAFILLIAVPYLGITRAYGRWFGHPQLPTTLFDQAEEIVSGIPKNDLILVDGDKTPIVFLYYLQRKGLSLSQTEGVVSAKELQPFRWLIRWNDSKVLSPLSKKLVLSSVKKVKDFTIYRIQGTQELQKLAGPQSESSQGQGIGVSPASKSN